MWLYIVIAAAVGGFLIGLVVGASTAMKVYTRRNDREAIGCLRVDHSFKDEPPALYLELNRSVETFVNEPYVLLRVQQKDFLSQ